jgi:rhodanese-related sulfurtransferase
MSNSRQPSRSTPSNARSRFAQILGFAAGALLVLVATWLVVRKPADATVTTTAPAVVTEAAIVPEASAASTPSAEFARISAADLKPLVLRNEVTIIDVRDIDSYLASHIPGSLHIPLSMIEGEIAYLPKGKPIVTYCTCPAEESSGAAAQILQHAGIANVSALLGGLHAWSDGGMPVESGRPAGPAQ